MSEKEGKEDGKRGRVRAENAMIFLSPWGGRNPTLRLAYSHPEKIWQIWEYTPTLLSTQFTAQRLKLLASFQTRNVRLNQRISVLRDLYKFLFTFHNTGSNPLLPPPKG